MQLKFGLANESFKYRYGIDDYDNSKEIFGCSSISLLTARRDWAAFQVVLKGDEEFTVSVTDNPVFSPRGPLTNVRLKVELEALPEASIKLYPVGLVEDDDRFLKSDILLNNEFVHVDRWMAQPVWVDIAVPENAKPGTYSGRVHIYTHSMFEDEKKVGTLTFELNVKNVVLPKPENYSFYLDLWQHLSNIARKHEVALWSDEHFTVIEEYVKSLAQLGQKSITVIASEIPWSGQRSFRTKNYLSDMFEYSMARVEKDSNGQFRYDFSVIERYVELCFKYGINREIEVFGLVNIWIALEEGYGGVAEDFPDAVRIRYYDRVDGSYKYMKSGAEIRDYIKALEQFFIRKNWIEKVRIVADEPADIVQYRERLKVLKETAPSFKYKTAINHVEFIGETKDEINDYVPVIPHACEKWDLLKEIRNDIKGTLLWYVCCWPDYPNTFIKSPLLESRLIGLLTAYMNFDGFLRWNYTVWPEKPREKIYYRYPAWKAGDTNFVYPAWNGAPLLTLRYKNLKRGIEDFELIQMLKKLHPQPEEVLKKIWDKILRCQDLTRFYTGNIKDVTELYSLEFSDYQEVKALLLDEISAQIK